MSSTSVHSESPKVTYGIMYAPDRTNEGLKMPPKQCQEGKIERDPEYIICAIKAETHYIDRKSGTRTDLNGKVLTGNSKVAKEIIETIEAGER